MAKRKARCPECDGTGEVSPQRALEIEAERERLERQQDRRIEGWVRHGCTVLRAGVPPGSLGPVCGKPAVAQSPGAKGMDWAGLLCEEHRAEWEADGVRTIQWSPPDSPPLRPLSDRDASVSGDQETP